MKKIVTTLTILGLIFSFSTQTNKIFASETMAEVYYNVSSVNPEESIGLDSTSVPSSSSISNLSVDSQNIDDFGGTSYHQTLYTNVRYTGCSRYTIKVKNKGDNNLTVKFGVRLNTYKKMVVEPHSTSILKVTGVSTKAKPYITFRGSYMDFSGTIAGYND